MHPLLKEQLLELRQSANTQRISRELIQAVTETIDTNSYRHQLDVISDDVEADLREILQQKPLNSLSDPDQWLATFNHPHGHNKLVSIQKKEDWYFIFEDPEVVFDETRFSLSELPLESKLLIIDLLQNL